MKNWIAAFIFITLGLQSFAQTDSTALSEEDDDEPMEWLKGDMTETHEYGIRFGLGTSTMLGGELDNPRPLIGLNGAAYYRYKYRPKAAIQVEGGVSMRGSTFANGTGEYSSITMYYIDVPLLWVRSLNQKGTNNLLLGAQYSYMLNPDIYIDPSSIADSQTPKFKTSDVMAVAGAQFYVGFVGFQLVAKYGLVDINDGLITGLKPAFKNKDIHNFTFEINFLF
ncbi:MAG: outer membrane beta-barrel protein [Bacteroidota bacterium]